MKICIAATQLKLAGCASAELKNVESSLSMEHHVKVSIFTIKTVLHSSQKIM